MDVRDRVLAALARQLGRPHGIPGPFVGAMLNRANRRTVTAAVDALAPVPGAVVADLGFGGGLGLELLLARAGAGGKVHGVEVSAQMLRRAARRFRREVKAGRLHLHNASMMQLPLADDSLEGTITINTIYFISELDRALSELARVLKGSGRAVIGLGDPEAMAQLPFTAHGFRLRPVREVADALTRAGLSLADHRRVARRKTPSTCLWSRHILPSGIAKRLPSLPEDPKRPARKGPRPPERRIAARASRGASPPRKIPSLRARQGLLQT